MAQEPVAETSEKLWELRGRLFAWRGGGCSPQIHFADFFVNFFFAMTEIDGARRSTAHREMMKVIPIKVTINEKRSACATTSSDKRRCLYSYRSFRQCTPQRGAIQRPARCMRNNNALARQGAEPLNNCIRGMPILSRVKHVLISSCHHSFTTSQVMAIGNDMHSSNAGSLTVLCALIAALHPTFSGI
jgi:hypothetical protein